MEKEMQGFTLETISDDIYALRTPYKDMVVQLRQEVIL